MSPITVTGRLSRDARTATGTDGTAWICVEIGMVGTGRAVEARHRIGSGHAAQYAAASGAKTLPAGAMVRIHAGGFDICSTPIPHLVLVGVSFIEHLETHHQRAAGAAERQAA